MTFQELPLSAPLQRAIADVRYETPTPIQQQSIPPIAEGKDVLGCAQTGTGKTAAFALPILERISQQPTHPQGPSVLILTPTRELAIQIEDSFITYGKYIPLKFGCIFGGVSQVPQENMLRKGVHILIATPGRLLDLLSQKKLSLQHIRIFVLDEADRMLDMGFLRDVKKIIALLPSKRQTLLFSATMPPEIRTLAHSILKNPKEVSVNPVSSTAQRIEQSVYFVEKKNKTPLLVYLLKNTEEKDRTLVFTRTKHGADKLVRNLQKNGIKAAAIHGNKSQPARQKALLEFKGSKIRVLVATDIASRGIDIDDLPMVVNYEVPEVPETYVHRIGRTGRAGQEGRAFSFCDPEESGDWKGIQKLIGVQVRKTECVPYTY